MLLKAIFCLDQDTQNNLKCSVKSPQIHSAMVFPGLLLSLSFPPLKAVMRVEYMTMYAPCTVMVN